MSSKNPMSKSTKMKRTGAFEKNRRTLAHVLALDSISELDSLVDTGGSSGGDSSPVSALGLYELRRGQDAKAQRDE